LWGEGEWAIVGGESSIDQRGCQNIENRSRPSTFCNLFGIYSETIFIRRSTFTGNYACNDYSADIKIVTVQLLYLLHMQHYDSL